MHVFLFDIDGTLLHTGGAGQAAMEAALTREFGVAQSIAGVSMAGRTDRAITADLFSLCRLTADEAACRRFVAAYLSHLPQFLQQRPGRVLPGIASLLDALARRDDVLLGLLTGNYRDGARLKLSHYRLDHHFRFGGYGDNHLDRDDVARDALAELHRQFNGNVDLDRVWVIGDTPADVRCGRAIGAKVIAVATGSHTPADLEAARPDHVVPDFTDPAAVLDLLP
jgi:phosphoglycolate phosphatase-like HAD superfamily hydrolase